MQDVAYFDGLGVVAGEKGGAGAGWVEDGELGGREGCDCVFAVLRR